MSHESYILSLVREIDASTKVFENSSIGDSNEKRIQALEYARKLTVALATPAEIVLHHSYEVLHKLV